MIEARLRMAARAYIRVVIASAKGVAGHRTDDGEDQPHPEADYVDEERIHKSQLPCLSQS